MYQNSVRPIIENADRRMPNAKAREGRLPPSRNSLGQGSARQASPSQLKAIPLLRSPAVRFPVRSGRGDLAEAEPEVVFARCRVRHGRSSILPARRARLAPRTRRNRPIREVSSFSGSVTTRRARRRMRQRMSAARRHESQQRRQHHVALDAIAPSQQLAVREIAAVAECFRRRVASGSPSQNRGFPSAATWHAEGHPGDGVAELRPGRKAC